MRRITSNVEARILEMLLAGDTYRDISREQDVTISTVNRIVEDERRRAPDFDEIRRLVLKLKKHNMTLFDAHRGAKLLEKLNEVGIPLQELETYLNLIKRILSEKNLQDGLLTYAMKLAKIESETGKSPEKIIEDLENALIRTLILKKQEEKSLNSLQKIESDEKKVKIELDRLNMEIDEILVTHSGLKTIGVEKLGRLVKFVQYYEAMGFKAEEVKKLAVWRQKLIELGIDPDKLGQWISENGPLESQSRRITWENKRLSRANRALTQTNDTFMTISQILETKEIIIPCKGCRTSLSLPLKSREELDRMLKENLIIPITCPVCNLPQQLTAWDFLFQLGMLVAPKDNFVIITIEQPQ